MASAGLACFAATPRAASQRLGPAALGLTRVAGGVIEVIGFPRAGLLAVHLVGQRGMAQPPAPVIARPDMHPHLSGHAS